MLFELCQIPNTSVDLETSSRVGQPCIFVIQLEGSVGTGGRLDHSEKALVQSRQFAEMPKPNQLCGHFAPEPASVLAT